MKNLSIDFPQRRDKALLANMRTSSFTLKPLTVAVAVLAASVLAACGGGSGDSGSSSQTAGTSESSTSAGAITSTTGGTFVTPVPESASMIMTCADGAGYQCSGGSIIRRDNGVALTSSGVQVYGKSTSDLATPIVDETAAFGLTAASGGIAEIRLAKDANGNVASPAVLLRQMGISWDNKTERPEIIETFRNQQGRVQLDANGKIVFSALPDSSNLAFYDFATKGTAGTQANYANNQYFPRDPSNPPRCPAGRPSCPTAESAGVQFQPGTWQSGGTTPGWANAGRLHGDGDVHAGDGQPQNGVRTILPGGSGIGAPYPGSKGYRLFDNWNYQYANLGAWATHDTVHIAEWGGGDEHNQNRRGLVAFGDVTPPSAIPNSGTAVYGGVVHGWYADNGVDDPTGFKGEATLTVNFQTREVIVAIQNIVTDNPALSSAPIAFNASTSMGLSRLSVANYLTGAVNNGTFKGGVSGRYFGPIVTTGSGSVGPAEIGGTFTMSAGNKVVLGGFVGRKK